MLLRLTKEVQWRIMYYLIKHSPKDSNIRITCKTLQGCYDYVRCTILPLTTTQISDNPTLYDNLLSLNLVLNNTKNLEKLSNFTKLTYFTIKVHGIEFFEVINYLPLSLFKFTILIDFTINRFTRGKVLEKKFHIDKVPKIKYLQIHSNNAIIQSKINSILCACLRLNKRNYYNSPNIAKLEKFKDKFKLGLFAFGKALYDIIDLLRNDLVFVELKNIDMNLILNERNFTSPSNKVHINYEFINLKLLLVDNVSLARYRNWCRKLQKVNLNLRNSKPLFIAIHDTISNQIFTSTALNMANWSTIKYSPHAFHKIKKELGLSI